MLDTTVALMGAKKLAAMVYAAANGSGPRITSTRASPRNVLLALVGTLR